MSTTNPTPAEDNWLEGPATKLPTGLNVLTILTFICNGIGIVGGFFIYAFAPFSYTQAVYNQDHPDQVPSFLRSFSPPHPVETARLMLDNRLPFLLLSLVAYSLCLYGAIQMRRLKKMGFTLYLIGDILPFINGILFLNAITFTGLGFYFGILIIIVFAILYAAQLKYMK